MVQGKCQANKEPLPAVKETFGVDHLEYMARKWMP